jgi:hypothetical protein
MSASIAIRMVYGYKVDSSEDRFVKAAEEVMAAFSDGMFFGHSNILHHHNPFFD